MVRPSLLATVVYARCSFLLANSSKHHSPCTSAQQARHALNHHSPAQTRPLPVKPVLQVQLRALLPKVQVASALQAPLLMGHGSTAANTEHVGVETNG